jgi:polyhydroxybutyrate depolymerase
MLRGGGKILLTLAAVLAGGSLVAAEPISSHSGTSQAGGQACARPPRPGNLYVQLSVGGVPRSALVHVPAGARAGQRLPALLAFHGAGGTGMFMAGYSGLQSQSDHSGFVSVFPSAARPHRRWVLAAEDPGGQADLQFVEQLLDRVEAMTCVDANRIYATGVSNGGGMAARLGCELSSRLAAIAPVAGGYGTLDACRPRRPLSVLEIHGTADRVVPYGGRPPDHAGSVRRFLAQWAAIDRCGPGLVERRFAPDSELFLRGPCADGTVVQHLKLYGGGHAWPGASPPDAAPTAPISAAGVVWSFFRGRVRTPGPA